ncbi:hypothetical protein DFR42_105199 [Undibacterium pigrum]|uniref:Uncharacterized protein n=1 Tax=Undibacterium pigrum TaxID=401470 RepID=A0A318JQM0_9BURK|nr:hypothetical protein DFR42_105199 [Undibacterium pigrum]
MPERVFDVCKTAPFLFMLQVAQRPMTTEARMVQVLKKRKDLHPCAFYLLPALKYQRPRVSSSASMAFFRLRSTGDSPSQMRSKAL